MAGVNTANWQYGDWQEQSTPQLRLDRLVLHITEARQAVVSTMHSEGRSQSMPATYIAALESQLRDLRAAINISAGFARRSSIPTVVRPQF